MRYLPVFVLLAAILAGWAGGARSGPPDPRSAPAATFPKSDSHLTAASDRIALAGREGGEDIASAFPIPSLPFAETGDTCDNVDDYDEVCPYQNSTSPDVVYAVVPSADGSLWIDLCGSAYDTKVYLYDADLNLVGCNDDYYYDEICGMYTSFLDAEVDEDQTYYIVVDGYGGDCGTYNLYVELISPPVIDCPPAALAEGEPPLVDDYEDQHNSGCDGEPPVWQELWAQNDNCAVMCGTTGWYTVGGTGRRDTDWFAVIAEDEQIVWTVESAWEVRMAIIAPHCDPLQVLQTAFVPFFDPTTLEFPTTPGELLWLRIAPVDDDGPLNEFDYVMTVCGIADGPIAAEAKAWGAVKSLYR